MRHTAIPSRHQHAAVVVAALSALLGASCAMPASKDELETAKNTFACLLGNDRIVIGQFAVADHFVVLDTTGKRLPDIVLPSGCDPLYMALSPDGQKVAFTGSRNIGGKESYGVFVCQPKQGEARVLIKKTI